MLASNSVGDSRGNSAIDEVQQLILHFKILQTSLYQLVKGGKHTRAHRAKPHADDIQAFSLRSGLHAFSLNDNRLLSEPAAASDHWGGPVWPDQGF